MNNSTDEMNRAGDLPFGDFLKLIFLGSARSPSTGRRVVLSSGASNLMRGVAGSLPILFLVLFVAGFVELSWANVVVFLTLVIGVFAFAMRAAGVETKEG